jgi:hypothetical protein
MRQTTLSIQMHLYFHIPFSDDKRINTAQVQIKTLLVQNWYFFRGNDTVIARTKSAVSLINY